MNSSLRSERWIECSELTHGIRRCESCETTLEDEKNHRPKSAANSHAASRNEELSAVMFFRAAQFAHAKLALANRPQFIKAREKMQSIRRHDRV